MSETITVNPGMEIDISGDRYQIGEQVWANWVGYTTPAEFMDGYDSIETAVSEYVKAVPDIFAEEPPTYYWREMNSPYTLAELLTRYLEDHADEF